MRWIKFQANKLSESATKFLPLPGGEGRGEGERKHTSASSSRTYPQRCDVMKITSFETWRCKRNESLFDSARTGRSPMNWDVVVLRLTTDTGLKGHATALAARSSVVTQAYLQEVIAPVVLGRRVTERPFRKAPL